MYNIAYGFGLLIWLKRTNFVKLLVQAYKDLILLRNRVMEDT